MPNSCTMYFSPQTPKLCTLYTSDNSVRRLKTPLTVGPNFTILTFTTLPPTPSHTGTKENSHHFPAPGKPPWLYLQGACSTLIASCKRRLWLPGCENTSELLPEYPFRLQTSPYYYINTLEFVWDFRDGDYVFFFPPLMNFKTPLTNPVENVLPKFSIFLPAGLQKAW